MSVSIRAQYFGWNLQYSASEETSLPMLTGLIESECVAVSPVHLRANVDDAAWYLRPIQPIKELGWRRQAARPFSCLRSIYSCLATG